jgi:hypothetical protein
MRASKTTALDLLTATITDEEVAALTGKTLQTIRRWGRLGLLPEPVGISRRPVRRSRAAVLKALGAIEAAAPAEATRPINKCRSKKARSNAA